MTSTERKSEEGKSSATDHRLFSRDEISRIGGDILQKTLGGLDAIREGFPKEAKEAAQFIKNRKDDLVKGMSKEFAQSLINSGIETFFSLIRQHKLELTIGIKKTEQESSQTRDEKRAKRKRPSNS